MQALLEPFLRLLQFWGSSGCEPGWISKLGIWEFISQVQVSKVGVLDVRLIPFNPQGEALGFEFPPDLGSLYQQWYV